MLNSTTSRRVVRVLASAALVASTLGLGGAANAVGYNTYVEYAAGTQNLAIASGDLNGDGTVDVVTADGVGNRIAIMLGNGDATFQDPVFYSTATSRRPVDVAVADLNKDGRLDVATANTFGGTGGSVSVFLAQAGGGYVRTDYASTAALSAVAIGDIDQDGNLDIAAADWSVSRAAVFTANGAGGYTHADYPVAGNPADIALGQVTGTSRLDIVTVSTSAKTVSVLDGANLAGARADYVQSVSANDVVIAELTGDAYLDIATSNQNDSTVSVLANNSNTSFGSATKVATPAQFPYSIAAADVDQNGGSDLVTPSVLNQVSVNYRGPGAPAAAAYVSSTQASFSVTTADFDGDHYPDIVAGNDGGTISILRGVDTTGPRVQFTSAPSRTTTETSPTIEFTANEVDVTYECRQTGPGLTPTWAACTSPIAYTNLPDGTYALEVRGRDVSGNLGAIVTHVFTVDTTGPIVAISSGPAGDTSETVASFAFTAEANAVVECKLDGPGSATGTWAVCTSPTNYSGLAVGHYTFSVRGKDSLGNVGVVTTRSFAVVKPSTTIPTTTPVEPAFACPEGNSEGVICWMEGNVMFLKGTKGTDTIVGTQGPDVVRAGAGADTITTFGGEDRIRGRAGADVIRSGAGNDVVKAGRGNDVVRGGKGADRLIGRAGNDRIFGGGGNDRIRGGRGADVLVGGTGRDVLAGRGGRDVFRARDQVADKVIGGRGADSAVVDAVDRVVGVESVKPGRA